MLSDYRLVISRPMSSANNTPTNWIVIPQDGKGHLIARQLEDGSLHLIALMLERPSSLAEDIANGQLLVTAVNAWNDVDALEARLTELRNAKKESL